MSILKFVWVGFIWLLLLSPAFTQTITDHVSVAERPDWVVEKDIPSRSFAADAPLRYLLVDQQSRAVEGDIERFYHTAVQLNTPSAVEDYSKFEVRLDPAFQSVFLHRLVIRRGEEVIDLLDLSKFDIYRSEVDRERLIYNGELEASLILPGLRVGDIVEEQLTILGGNPALQGHYALRIQHAYGVPVQERHWRHIAPGGSALTVQGFQGADPFRTDRLGAFDVYSWSGSDIAARDVDEDAPNGYQLYPVTRLSTFGDWQEVGAFFHPVYDASQFQSAKVREIASTIAQAHETPAGQVRAALDYVQQEIRYLGIELGAGGYVPRPPDLVLERRFGDCKDMVVLLNAILTALGFEAQPLLVDLDKRGMFDHDIPSHAAFDHVVTMVQVEGRSYYLDPTRGPQLGDLDHLQQADFDKGVVISANSPGMIDAIAPQPDWHRETSDVFDLTDPDIAKFSTQTVFRMGQADRTLRRTEGDGLADLEEQFLTYFRGRYETIKQAGAMEMDIDHEAGEIKISATYTIPDYAEIDPETEASSFTFLAEDIRTFIPDVERAERSAPLAVETYPFRVRQVQSVIRPDQSIAPPSRQTQSAPGLDFTLIERWGASEYQQVFELKLTEAQISVADQAEFLDAADMADGLVWTEFDLEQDAAWVVWLDANGERAFVFYAVAVFLISVWVVYLHRNRDADARAHQVLFPVSMFKFVLLSVVSFGVYQIYWTYKNWVWMRHVGGKDVSPFWRTVFAPIWNFSLFPQVMKIEPAAPRGWQRLALVLATLYFVSFIFERIFERSDDAPVLFFWLGCGGILCYLPIAKEVLRKNEANGKYVMRNSTFGWPAIGLLVLYLPIFVLLTFGLTLS